MSLDVFSNSSMTTDDKFETIELVLNNLWLWITAVLIFLMQTGFSMLESGSVQSSSTVNVLFKNIADTAVATIGFWLIGYAFAYGDSPSGFIGITGFALSDDTFYTDDLASGKYPFFIQKLAFATTAVTIVSGSVAERCSLNSYFAYSFVISSFIYPVVVCWCWGNGWLSPFASDTDNYLLNGSRSNNYIDYAGSGVIHIVGGISGLMGAIVIGPRKGRFLEDGSSVELPKNSLPHVALGTSLLSIGWFAFNAGSTECITGTCSLLISKIVVVTCISSASSTIAVIMYQYVMEIPYDFATVCNGLLGGLVSITGACAVVEPWAGFVIGFIGAFVFLFSSKILVWLKIDDPLDAAAVHGCCGIWGVLAVGMFGTDINAKRTGIYIGSMNGYNVFGSGEQFVVQLIAVLVIIAWTATTSFSLFHLINKLIGLRVSTYEEKNGLDLTTHGSNAFSVEITTFRERNHKKNVKGRSQGRGSHGMYYTLNNDDEEFTLIPGNAYCDGSVEDVD